MGCVDVTETVQAILQALEESEFEAYVVGGAVRDLLLGTEPHDYDIVTSASPDQITGVARTKGWRTVENLGRNFGVVVIVIAGVAVETATFRGESYGKDSHRPEKIWQAHTLREDVLRRDFTVNAMAMDCRGKVYDFVGGRRDLADKRLVTVGDAASRFQEDALRMFRLCRLVGQLDFLPDTDSIKGLGAAFSRVSGLSLERVRYEIERLLVTPAVAKGLDVLVQSGLSECSCRRKVNGSYEAVLIMPELTHLVNTPQTKPYHIFDAWIHTLSVVQHTPPDLTVRYAALFHDVGKGLPGIRGFHDGRLTDYGHDKKSEEIAIQVLTRLGVGPKRVQRVAWLVKNHMKFHSLANDSGNDASRWIRQEALSGNFRYTADLVEAFAQEKDLAIADVIGCGWLFSSTKGTASFGDCLIDMATMMPINTRDLRYSKDLLTLCGPETGECLQNLLRRVQMGQLENKEEPLQAAAAHWLARKHR